MSIVSYYARIDATLLEALETNPDLFHALPKHAGPSGNQLLYLDKDWVALSWLLSAKAREEQKHQIVGFALNVSGSAKRNSADPDAWVAAKACEASRRGLQLVDTDAMPDDPALTAIQGRGPGETRFQIGLHTRTFVPAEVARLSAALDRMTEADLREHFDLVVMEALDVEGILWTEEDPDVLAKILIPCFDRLKTLYRLAAQVGQHVLVVIS